MVEKLTAAEKKKAMGQLSGWKKSVAARPLKRLYLRRFQCGLWLDEPCRHAGGKNGPSPGMGQCL